MGGLWDILRALKHHVLEQMSKAGPADLLVSRSGVIINGHENDRNRVIDTQNNSQPVGQGK